MIRSTHYRILLVVLVLLQFVENNLIAFAQIPAFTISDCAKLGEQVITITPNLLYKGDNYQVHYFANGNYLDPSTKLFFRATPDFFKRSGIQAILVTRNGQLVADEETLSEVLTLYNAAYFLYERSRPDELGNIPPGFEDDLERIILNIYLTGQGVNQQLFNTRADETAEALRGIITVQTSPPKTISEFASNLKEASAQANSVTEALDLTVEVARFSNDKQVRDIAKDIRNIYKSWQPITEQGTAYFDVGKGTRLEFANALEIINASVQVIWIADLKRERSDWLETYRSAFVGTDAALDQDQLYAALTVEAEAEDAWIHRANIILDFVYDQAAKLVTHLSTTELARIWVKAAWQSYGKRTVAHSVAGVFSAAQLGLTLADLLYGLEDLYSNFTVAQRANELRLIFLIGRLKTQQQVLGQNGPYEGDLAETFRAAYMLEALAAAKAQRSYADGVEATVGKGLLRTLKPIGWFVGNDWQEAVQQLRELANQTEQDAENNVGHPPYIDTAIELAKARMEECGSSFPANATNAPQFFNDCRHDYEGIWYCARESKKYYILYADLSNPSVRIDVAMAAGYSTDPQPFYGETVQAIARRNADHFPGLQVIAGINANYFGSGHHGPQGLVKATTGQTDTPLFSKYLNSLSHDGVEKKSSLGISLAGELLIDRNFYNQHANFINGEVGDGRAITAGPRIIWQGEVSHPDNFILNCEEEDYTTTYCTKERPRAALGIIGQQGLVLTVGETSMLQQTATLLKQHGVEHAMKLDDGSSAQLWYIDEPFIPEGGGSHVVNALLIYSKSINERVTAASSATVLVMDVSGSMEWPDPSGKRKIEAARDAGRDILNMIEPFGVNTGGSGEQEEHQLSLISFSDMADLESPLTSNLTAVGDALTRLQPMRGTNMAHGLALANEQLAAADPTTRHVLILLSDGVPTVDLSSAQSEDREALKQEILSGPVATAQAQKYCIYTIGFGEPGAIDSDTGELSIDIDFLKAIAAGSAPGCGGYFPATDTFEITNVYARARCESVGECLEAFGGQIAQGETTSAHSIAVPDNQGKLFASLNWPGSSLELILKDPEGTQVDEDYPGSTVSVFDNLVYVIVDDPIPGEWQSSVFGQDVPEGVSPYNLTFSARPAPVIPTPIPEPTEEPVAIPAPPTPEPAEPEPVVEPSGSGVTFVFFIVALLGVVGTTAFFAFRSRRTVVSRAGLRVIAGQAAPVWASFRQGQLRLGRGHDNELVVSDTDASRYHAVIRQIPQGYLLEDLNSTNGTYVNGERVERQMLHAGDIIQIGHTQLRFDESAK